ncbi:phospholipid/cholesterol/gamma-HCH transport system substrate-binding protein [Rhodococcoides kyotonense]|uniref:Phospholipid/cholesterol/gamma-HCH transport system substrate-binding protein n=2 Tax=Rhodococcoides kyotonense TaxID=398843 RepID=A0A239MJZ4_9NOCA|nr:phospholipid/cholesterol/gamma-HCH transport system substrate-binding protein [Rhodococcus kyotonensis]
MRMRPLVAIVGATVVGLSATACSQGVYGIPLPGGADTGSNPMHLTIQFQDVLDLVPQSTVKVDGVEVGRVDSISVPNGEWTADVDVVVNDSVDLPANALAAVEQTSILGEKFIQLTVPTDDADPQKLQDGDTIPLDRTRSTTNIEQVLGALSLVLNGGGVGQLAPIVKELNAAFDGREGTTRSLLEQANTLIGGLEEQRDDITRALDGLDVLTTEVSGQTEKIDRVLADLPIATDVLEQQRPQLTQMLGQLDRLGAVGTDVINQSKDNLIADLRALRPTLQALAGSADDIVTTLPLIPTLPFPDGIEEITQGDSANLYLSLDLSIGTTLRNLGVGEGDPVYIPPKYGDTLPLVDPSNPYYNGNGPRPGWPTISLLPLPPIVPNPSPPPGVPVAPGTEPVASPVNAPTPFAPLNDLLEQFGGGL